MTAPTAADLSADIARVFALQQAHIDRKSVV